jgi:CheY-like chemotaxis protein
MDSQAPKKLLIVDQERFSALIAKMLSDSFITETAKDGIEAISYLRTNLPDLLLVEESIPGDGLRFCELMGMNPKFQDLPIILMSVSPSSKGILRARAAGVNSYLAKPFRPKDLQLRIGSIFATAETIQESGKGSNRSKVYRPSPPHMPRFSKAWATMKAGPGLIEWDFGNILWERHLLQEPFRKNSRSKWNLHFWRACCTTWVKWS